MLEGMHEHTYPAVPLACSEQVPPFSHVCSRYGYFLSEISVSHLIPVLVGGHGQTKPPVLVELLQVPSFSHG